MSEKRTGVDISLEELTPLYGVLNEEERAFLEEHHSLHVYKKNELIYKEGDAPNGFLILVRGKIKIFMEGVGGRDQILRMAKPPEFIGYRSLFSKERHIASAIAIEEAAIVHIPEEAIFKLLATSNTFALQIVESLAKDLGFSNNRLVNLTQKHIRGRLAESLLFLKETYGMEEDGFTVNIYLSREDLANLSNMTTSNAIRTLSIFASEKVIAIDGRRIKILDEEKLKRISRIG